ncbi:hypothetical protein ACFDR8_000937 [Arthrobacter sp. MP_2.3]
MTFDPSGYLHWGPTYVTNDTGRTERVLTASEWQGVSND